MPPVPASPLPPWFPFPDDVEALMAPFDRVERVMSSEGVLGLAPSEFALPPTSETGSNGAAVNLVEGVLLAKEGTGDVTGLALGVGGAGSVYLSLLSLFESDILPCRESS